MLIKVSKGEIDRVAKHILDEQSQSVLEISSRVGQLDVNLVVRVVYKGTDEIFQMMKTMSKIEYIENVQWSEIVEIMIRNETGLLENILKLSDV